MRGKLDWRSSRARRRRLIPAHAGKTLVDSFVFQSVEAHPRACGENMFLTPSQSCCQGSSPRMRGKHLSAWRRSYLNRLIPAHAGKTENPRRHSHGCRAHPRACGENFNAYCNVHVRQGSSPRMRGKPKELDRPISFWGLIPAHAGKTSRIGNQRRTCRAHPRACGENELVFDA